MPSILDGRRYYHTSKRTKAAKAIQAAFRRKARSKSKSSKAKARKSLSTGYKGAPNQYRFIRETRPDVVDMGVNGSGITLIPGTGAIPNTSVLNLANFQINQLAGGFAEFGNLFANYKIDKIETILIPQWQNTVNPDGAGSGTTQIPNLMITRINSKFLVNGYTLPGTAEANRDKLAQVQKKTRSLYGNRKWLRLITNHPLVFQDINDGAGGVNLTTKAQPWLPTATAADQEFSMNDIIFADTLSGIDLPTGVYKYRFYHRVHFRCSFVG